MQWFPRSRLWAAGGFTPLTARWSGVVRWLCRLLYRCTIMVNPERPQQLPAESQYPNSLVFDVVPPGLVIEVGRADVTDGCRFMSAWAAAGDEHFVNAGA